MRARRYEYISRMLWACYVLAACASSAAPATVAQPTAMLARSEAATPANPCDTWDTPIVSFIMNIDTTSPRCLKVTPTERLQVINRTDQIVQVRLAHVFTWVGPGDSYTFDKPFGAYFAPGVHSVWMSCYAGSGGELWLQDRVDIQKITESFHS